MQLITLKRISRQYRVGNDLVRVLVDVSLDIAAGDRLALVGASGSGKSTLMNIIGLLDSPDSGQYEWQGQSIDDLQERQRAVIRNRSVGFVFQQFHLLPYLTVEQNVELPMIYAQVPKRERLDVVHSLLRQVGLENRIFHRPAELSGGERQRVAIARSIANGPKILLADEPTGALDSKNGRRIVDLLFGLCETHEMALMFVTHDLELAKKFPRVIRLCDGRLVDYASEDHTSGSDLIAPERKASINAR